MTKLMFKNQIWCNFIDVIVITLLKNVIKLTPQNFSFLGP